MYNTILKVEIHGRQCRNAQPSEEEDFTDFLAGELVFEAFF